MAVASHGRHYKRCMPQCCQTSGSAASRGVHLAISTARLADEVLVGDLPGLDPGVTELSRDILLLPFETGLATLEACLAVCKNEASSLFLKACAFASCMSDQAWMESARALALPGNLRPADLLSASWRGNMTPSSHAPCC